MTAVRRGRVGGGVNPPFRGGHDALFGRHGRGVTRARRSPSARAHEALAARGWRRPNGCLCHGRRQERLTIDRPVDEGLGVLDAQARAAMPAAAHALHESGCLLAQDNGLQLSQQLVSLSDEGPRPEVGAASASYSRTPMSLVGGSWPSTSEITAWIAIRMSASSDRSPVRWASSSCQQPHRRIVFAHGNGRSPWPHRRRTTAARPGWYQEDDTPGCHLGMF
jgi:hypothetical protein